jgi:FimV-like protein
MTVLVSTTHAHGLVRTRDRNVGENMPLRYLTLTAALLTIATTASAQSAAEHMARGDSLYRAIQVRESLAEYTAVLAADSSNYEALWRASRNIADLAEYDPDASHRKAQYRLAEQLARKAIAVNPGDAEAHFDLARALGRVALSVGKKDRVKYAKEIREHALEALRLQPDHPGALHVLGVWNAEVMRLSGLTRFFAKNFLGGRVFDQASWPNAVRYMERAVAVDPARIVHRLDLAQIYIDTDEKDKAREQLERMLDAPQVELNDPKYKDEAKAILERLK